MKTHTTPPKNARRMMATTLVLAFLALLPAQAQDAFYVYRNDGDFNGFFYDQIVRMNYSKVDLQGETHDKYVVQEIETEDSLYRIPLASIDSIGFQQPEIILNPNLKNMEQIGMHPYIQSWTSFWYEGKRRIQINVDTSIPKEMTPKVGDVLVDWSDDYYGSYSEYPIKGQFSGKVTEVRNGLIFCEPLSDQSDIFVQFVTTEMITTDEQGLAKHRLAGWQPHGQNRAKQGQGTVSLIDYEGTLKRTFSPTDGVDISLECDVKLGVKMQVSYNISWKRLYVKTDMLSHASAKPAVSVQASKPFYGHIDLTGGMATIKFPINLPIFQTKPVPAIDIKGSGSASMKLTFPEAKFAWNPAITFDSDKWPMLSFTAHEDKPEEEVEASPIDTGDLELSLSGSLQAGVLFSANIETNDWIKDVFSSRVALELMVGPKIEGSLKLSTAGLASQGAYGSLKHSSVKFHPLSADLEAKARLHFLWKDPEETTFLEQSRQWGTAEWYIFPDFKDTKAEYVKDRRSIDFSTKAMHKTFLPNYVTAKLYDYDNNLVESYKHHWPTSLVIDSIEVDKSFYAKKAGDYIVKHGVEVAGYDIEAGETWVSVPPYIVHESMGKDSIEVSGNAQTIEQIIVTNVTKLDNLASWQETHWDANDNFYNHTSTSFAHATFHDLDTETGTGKAKFDIDENNTLLSRYTDVQLRAFLMSDNFDEDTLRIKQKPKYNDATHALLNASGGYIHYNYEDKSWGDELEWDTAPVACSRSGDVLTLTGSNPSPVYGNTYTYKIVVDMTDRKNVIINGECERTGSIYRYKMTFKGTSLAPGCYDVSSSAPEGTHAYMRLELDSFEVTSLEATATDSKTQINSITPPTYLQINLYY